MGDVAPPASEVTCEMGDDHVATIEVHRGPNNYLSPLTLATVVDLLENLAAEGTARAAVLCSEGKHFCAGADFRGDMAEDGAKGRLYRQVPAMLRTKIPNCRRDSGRRHWRGSRPGSTRRISESLLLRHASPVISPCWAFTEGFGLSVTLPALIGTQRAAELLYTGRNVRGSEALTIGLCDRLVEAESLRDEARRFAGEIAQAAPLAVGSIRSTIRGDLAERVNAALQHELDEQDRLMLTADFREGLQASAERRPPVFSGR